MKPNTALNSIRSWIEAASTATGYIARTAPGFQEATAYIKSPAMSGGVLNIKTTQLPALFNADGTWRGFQPIATPAGEIITMAGALAKLSRTVQAGAHLVIEDPAEAQALNNGTGGIARVMQHFTTIEPAPFAAVVLEDADVPVSALPSYKREIRWGSAKPQAVRFEIKRKERHTYGEQMAVEILASLAMGIARAADAAFLAELAALDDLGLINPFTIGAAAAQGLTFQELRALIGTAGTGAMVNADGALACLPFNPTGWQAGGIRAELTADTAATYTGAFNRAGLAVTDEIPVTVARLDKNGTLAVTAHVSFLPLIPNPAVFWKLA